MWFGDEIMDIANYCLFRSNLCNGWIDFQLVLIEVEVEVGFRFGINSILENWNCFFVGKLRNILSNLLQQEVNVVYSTPS